MRNMLKKVNYIKINIRKSQLILVGEVEDIAFFLEKLGCHVIFFLPCLYFGLQFRARHKANGSLDLVVGVV